LSNQELTAKGFTRGDVAIHFNPGLKKMLLTTCC
jgi:hypothetical protein